MLETSPSRSLRARRRSSAWRSRGLRLGLHAMAPVGSANDGIPCSTIARGRKRNLGQKPKSAVESKAKSFKQCRMGRVTQGLTAGVEGDRQVVSEDGEEDAGLLDGDRTRKASFDATVLGRRDAGSSSHVGSRDATIEAVISQILKDSGIRSSASGRG